MLIPLKLVRDRPLQQQLFEQLRDLIASGGLQAGTRMPSTRMVAEQFAVSRITVLLAYERLIAEGYLISRLRRGTRVAPQQRGILSPAAETGERRQAAREAAGAAGVGVFVLR